MIVKKDKTAKKKDREGFKYLTPEESERILKETTPNEWDEFIKSEKKRNG